MNDGLAFPFVHLGLLIATLGPDPALWLHDWLRRDLVYRLAIGVLVGAAMGWALGQLLFGSRGGLADRAPGILALVRGVGPVYYLSYASGQIEFINASQIWALVAFTIFASTLIHGATARFVVDRVAGIRSKER